MKYEYTGRHLDVTPALRSHVENHFDKIKHLFDDENTKVQVIIEVEKGGRHSAEVILKWRDQVLTAASKQPDMYLSLTQTIDKIEKQALKLKDKVIDKHQKKKKVSTVPDVDEVKPEPRTGRIISVKQSSIKPMTDDEAVLKLNDGADQFVVFRDSESEKISVIYKRKDGNYGLIRP
jgi:putative sigma-54 modulation protein